MNVEVTSQEAEIIRSILDRYSDSIIDTCALTWGQLADLTARFEEVPAMPKSRIYTFTVSAQAAERQFTGFIDMLRYDGATVIEADTSVIVLHTDNPPTTARWASFGVLVLSTQEGEYPDIRTLKAQAADKLPAYPRR